MSNIVLIKAGLAGILAPKKSGHAMIVYDEQSADRENLIKGASRCVGVLGTIFDNIP
jgi:hypothetical protein